MTKWIRLRENISGGRADGRSWPPANEVSIDVPDWEAEHAISAGWAYEVDPPGPEPAPEPVAPAEKPPEPAEAVPAQAEAEVPAAEPEPAVAAEPEPAVQEPADEPVTEPAEEAVPEPPRPSDPKQDWVDYAVTQGMDEGKAAAMSKADLMSRYGGRL